MNHISGFLLNFLCAAAFCLAVILGLYMCLTKRLPGKTFDKMQKLFGATLLLMALHVLSLNIEIFFGLTLNTVLRIALVTMDIASLVCCILMIIISLQPSRTQGEAPRVQVMEQSEPDEPELSVAEETEMNVAEGAEMNVADESTEDETVEQLDTPNVDDFLFFQKVECLMVNERLFCEQEISREAVATAIGTNRTYLARSIKSATGMTFSEYITTLRTSYAAKLLTTSDEPLDLIGTLVGFRSKSAYYRAFSAAYGCSPSEYRKNSVCLHTLESATINN
ncbi:MAG: helix-turn-helix transcriptional regulator [Bacteroidales bacterium]|nr:helix-turn-helix transcriptional regulator [Bacteroidales bacterium]